VENDDMTKSSQDEKSKLINIGARFFETAEKFADHPAVGMAGDDAYLTYRQLAEKVRECAVYLGRIDPEEPIGLLSENRPAWGKFYMAIHACGGVVVPVDSLLKKDELKAVFIESMIRRLIVSPKFLDIVNEINDTLERKLEIINLEAIPPTQTDQFIPRFNEDPDSLAVLIFTSGTTGKSKQVMLTHRNIISDLDGIVKYLPFGPGDRFLSVLPLHHTFEATCGFLTPILNGCAIYYIKALNSREILAGIKKHQITIFVSVPLIYEKLYHSIQNGINKAPAATRTIFRLMMSATRSMYALTGKNPGKKMFASLRKKAGLGSIRLMVSGGAPLNIKFAKGFNFLGFDFVEGYGLTETSPVLSVSPVDRNKFGSVGLPLHRVEVKIDNPNEIGVGEVIVRGPMITPGYKDNPEETARLLQNGWLHTGDMGRLDDEGYLFIMGRKKNLIVSAAGKNIYPEEIEAELVGSPLILEAMVWGKEASNGREEVAAMIFPDFDALTAHLGKDPENISDEEMKAAIDPEIRAISARMADFKRVKHVDYLRNELEKTSSKKIKRFVYKK
jgi:long-chain acyl-CoA synthetase